MRSCSVPSKDQDYTIKASLQTSGYGYGYFPDAPAYSGDGGQIKACYIGDYFPWDKRDNPWDIKPFTPYPYPGVPLDPQPILIPQFSIVKDEGMRQANREDVKGTQYEFKVPGFAPKEISVRLKNGVITIEANKRSVKASTFYSPVSYNATLNDIEEIDSVELANGILTILTVVVSEPKLTLYPVGFKRKTTKPKTSTKSPK